MPKTKQTTLIEGGNIACNKICQTIKNKGLPHNSIWIYLTHLVHNLDTFANLTDTQRQTIITLYDEYLDIIKDLSNPDLIHKQGIHLLSEISEIQHIEFHSRVKDEQKFAADLLSSITINLENLYKLLHSQNTSATVDRLKNKTLQALQKTTDKPSILAIIEDGFNKVGEAVTNNMTTIKDSLDSMLNLEAKALIDPLTGIFNRRFFDQELPKIVKTFLDMEGQKSFSMLVLDIDNFKEVNDQYGHFVGDVAIQRVAEILQKNCRAGIDSPIRLGGDEFALFLIGADENIASRKAGNLREQIAATTIKLTKEDDSGQPRNISFPLTVSIGVSELNYAWRDVAPEKLIDSLQVCNPDNIEPHYKLTCKIAESADKALYDAKNQGKNRISIYETN